MSNIEKLGIEYMTNSPVQSGEALNKETYNV